VSSRPQLRRRRGATILVKWQNTPPAGIAAVGELKTKVKIVKVPLLWTVEQTLNFYRSLPGVVYAAPNAKLVDHGSGSAEDTHVPLVVVDPRHEGGLTLNCPVSLRQIAPQSHYVFDAFPLQRGQIFRQGRLIRAHTGEMGQHLGLFTQLSGNLQRISAASSAGAVRSEERV
jgi:hypothetical protein